MQPRFAPARRSYSQNFCNDRVKPRVEATGLQERSIMVKALMVSVTGLAEHKGHAGQTDTQDPAGSSLIRHHMSNKRLHSEKIEPCSAVHPLYYDGQARRYECLKFRLAGCRKFVWEWQKA
jgi:hypothetical protein